MYVYQRSEPTLWTVGYFRPDGSWEAESDHDNQEEAAKRVAWLNGSTSATPDAETSRPHKPGFVVGDL